MLCLLLFDFSLQLLHGGTRDALPLNGGLCFLIVLLHSLHVFYLNAEV